MSVTREPDLIVFCWIVGCGIPLNATSVCKYLFEKGTNKPKPQLKNTLNNCQLYAAALSNIYDSDKSGWKSFAAISRQIELVDMDFLPRVKKLCNQLGESAKSDGFNQERHRVFIEVIMQISMSKLAPISNLDKEIRRLLEENPTSNNHIDLPELTPIDSHSPGNVAVLSEYMRTWLLTVAKIAIQEILKDKQVNEADIEEFVSEISLISLLSCAAFHYGSRVEALFPSKNRDAFKKGPSLDAQWTALVSVREPITRGARLADDQANAQWLFGLLGAFVEQKASDCLLSPPHASLITGALCALPHFVGEGVGTLTQQSALCSVAAAFHWLTGQRWPEFRANQLQPSDSPYSTKKLPKPNNTALRNSAALQSLVRSSGGLAKKARPANPQSIPAAVVDLNTVEQLVSSTTSDPGGDSPTGDVSKQSQEQGPEEGLLGELACTAVLAAVSVPNSSGGQTVRANGNQSVKPRPFYLSKTGDNGTENLPAVERSLAYSTFKMTSPSKNLPPSAIPRIKDTSASTNQQTSQEIVSTTSPRTSSNGNSTANGQTRRKTNWEKQGEERRTRSLVSSTATQSAEGDGSSRSGSVALRLSLDQQRRAIEANRQRALRQVDRVAAQRNQAAFLALLHSYQKRRRRQGTGDETPSLAEDCESEAASTKAGVSDECTVSQSDLPPEGSIEGEEEAAEFVAKSPSDQRSYSPQPPVDAEQATDMEDFPSSCVPNQAEILTSVPPNDSPIQCSSPHMRTPAGDEISTPRVNRRLSPSSSSSPGYIPEDSGAAEFVEEHGDRLSTSRHRHSHPNHHQHHPRPPPSVRSQPRPESRCSQCSHCTGHDYYYTVPRHRYREPNKASVGADNYDDDEDYGEYYGTLPARRSSKPPIGRVRQLLHSASQQRQSRLYPDAGHEVQDYYVNETSSEIYWGNQADRRRTHSRQRARQHQLYSVDSSEESNHPNYDEPGLPTRHRDLELNHLGKSTGTGLDALVIAELARSVTTLRSDIERLTAAQQGLSRPDDRGGADVGAPLASRPLATGTPSGSTRAMWSSRTPLRYPSQLDVQEAPDLNGNEVEEEEEEEIANEGEVLKESSPMPSMPVEAPDLVSKADRKKSTENWTTREPEVIKPAEKLIINFESPDSERLQRARERLEARRAADRTRVCESALRVRITDKEAQFMADARSVPNVLADSFVSTDLESENSGFPVHTTNGTEATVSPSALPKATHPHSARASTVRRKPPADVGGGGSSGDGNASGRTSRSASLNRSSLRGSVSSSSGARANTTTRMNSANGRREAASTCWQRAASRPSAGGMSNGLSLSSLHRLENGDESTYSGPGLPISGIAAQPRLFVKPKSKSNRQVIVNAISHCCLAGTVNEAAKKLALQELAASDGSHFIVLFRDSRCQYRALYGFDFDSEELKFICGNGPRKITHSMCDKFFKYNSGAKQFSEITSTKHLSAVVDAVTIQNSWWLRPPPLHSNAARASASAAQVTSEATK